MKKRSTFFVFIAIGIVTSFLLLGKSTFAQSGQKWSADGNTVQAGDRLGSINNMPLRLITNNAERIRITPDGKIGIGLEVPQYSLDVAGRFHLNGKAFFDSTMTVSDLLVLYDLTSQSIAAGKLDVSGRLTVAGSVAMDSLLTVRDVVILNSVSANKSTTNDLQVNALQGNGLRLVSADSLGQLAAFNFSSNPGDVLYGNGQWGSLPVAPQVQTWWQEDSNDIHPTNTGNVGIGTADPNFKLDVNGDIRSTGSVYASNLYAEHTVNIGGFTFKNGATGNTKDSISAENPVNIRAENSIGLDADTVTIKNRVGIGTNSPAAALDVYGDVIASGSIYTNNLYAANSVNIGGFRFSNDTLINARDSIRTTKAVSFEAFQSIDFIADTVTMKDRVGIGTRTPTEKLSVIGNVGVQDTLKVGSGIRVTEFAGEGYRPNNSTRSYKMVFADNVGNLIVPDPNVPIFQCNSATPFPWLLGGNEVAQSQQGAQPDWIGTCNGYPFKMYTNNAERMRITEQGNVGVGTQTPLVKWHVAGDAMFSGSGSTVTFAPFIRGTNNVSTETTPDFTWWNNDRTGIFHPDADVIGFTVQGTERARFNEAGDFYIKQDLYVKNTIRAKEYFAEVPTWYDFVFEPGYDLMSIAELEVFVNTNKHLPDVPTTKQVSENGVDLADMTSVLLKKVEELTLYIIELNKKNDLLEEKVKMLEQQK